MKRNALSPALFALLALFTSPLFAQKPTEWKGGAPGREADWNCPQNWTAGSVPNEFSDVRLTDVSTAARPMPVIKAGLVQVNSLTIEGGATLTVGERGNLLVFGRLVAADAGSVRGSGRFRVLDEGSAETLAQARH